MNELRKAIALALCECPSVWTRVNHAKSSGWWECCRHADGDVVDPIVLSEHDTEEDMKMAQLLHIDEMRADAALAAIEEAGWQCVPKEATVEMFRAAGASPEGVTPRGGIDWLGRMLPKYWQAMLAAAPKP